jgi:hypothetical protein
MKIRSSLLLIFLLHSVVCLNAGAGASTDDHLVPFKPSIYDELRPTLYRKLCVTPANYGRMIELPPGPERTEWAVSVSCDEASVTANACEVTLTRAASNLDYIMQERRGKDPLNAVEKVKVIRKQAPIQKEIAIPVRAAWLRFLRNSKPSRSRPNDPIALHAPKIEFWLPMSGAKAIKAEAPDKPGKSVMTLIALGRRLADYCEQPESQRGRLAAQIELDAKRLGGPAGVSGQD